MSKKELAEELHIPIIRQIEKKKKGRYTHLLWTYLRLISKFNKGFWFLLCVIDIFSKYAWIILRKDEKGITINNENYFSKNLNESNQKPNNCG